MTRKIFCDYCGNEPAFGCVFKIEVDLSKAGLCSSPLEADTCQYCYRIINGTFAKAMERFRSKKPFTF